MLDLDLFWSSEPVLIIGSETVSWFSKRSQEGYAGVHFLTSHYLLPFQPSTKSTVLQPNAQTNPRM